MKPKYSTMDLYGVPATEFKAMLPILKYRKLLACKQLQNIVKDNFIVRDEAKIFAINKAIEFNDKLIMEIENEL